MSKDQWECPELRPILAYLIHNELPENLVESRKVIIMSEQYFYGIVFSITCKLQSPTWAHVVVPRKHRANVMQSYHEQHAHLRFEKTYLAIRAKYHWRKCTEMWKSTCPIA